MTKKIKMNDEVYIGNSNVQFKDLLGTLLWTNPNPSSEFAGQVINIDNLNEYDVIEIFYRCWGPGDSLASTKFIDEGVMMSAFAYSLSVIRMASRKVRRTTSGLSFEASKFIKGWATAEQDTNTCIPVYIVGYKTGLFS